jgi:hypothetical protein
MLIILIVLLLVFGLGGFHLGGPYMYGGGGIGLIILIIIILLLMRVI